MNTPKVSIIVPVYNAGKYLSPLLESLIRQTLREIEIILVLDCPTDGSDRVAGEYAARDPRIVLVRNPENLHVGLSRNAGMRIARGEYIGFCDHDDTVTTEMFGRLYAKGVEEDAEVVLSDYYVTDGKEKWYRGFPQNLSSEAFIRCQLPELINFHDVISNQRAFSNNHFIWNSLFKRSFLERHAILFPDNRRVTFEDRLFLLRVFTRLQRIATLPEAHYTHIWHPGNTGAGYHYKSLRSITAFLLALHRFLTGEHLLPRFSDEYTDAVVLKLYASFRHELRHRSLPHALRRLAPVRRDPILQAALRRAFRRLRHYPPTKTAFLFLACNPFLRPAPLP